MNSISWSNLLSGAMGRKTVIIQAQAIILMALLWSGYTHNWTGIGIAVVMLFVYLGYCGYEIYRKGLTEDTLDHATYATTSVFVALVELGLLWLFCQLYRWI